MHLGVVKVGLLRLAKPEVIKLGLISTKKLDVTKTPNVVISNFMLIVQH